MSIKRCRKGLHEMTPENTYQHPAGYRQCRACRAAWLEARPGYGAAVTRRRRSNPEAAERDREASRRWKREHPEQVRETEMQRQRQLRPNDCERCGSWTELVGLCGRCRRSDKADARRREIKRLRDEGASLKVIAASLDSTVGSIGVEITVMRAAGWDVPYRRSRRTPA